MRYVVTAELNGWRVYLRKRSATDWSTERSHARVYLVLRHAKQYAEKARRRGWNDVRVESENE